MSEKIDLAAFQQMERDALSHEEWMEVMKREGWPRGGRQKQHERYRVYLAAQDGRTFASPSMPIVIAVTQNLAAKYQKWENLPTTWGELKELWLDYERWPLADRKELIPAFCGVEFRGDQRANKQVVASYLEISDHDDGQTMAESAAIAERNHLETIIAPSFNFGSTQIEIKRDDFIAWAKANERSVELTEALGREYLESTGKLLPAFARTATYDGAPPQQRQDGTFVYVIKTEPREKHRCIRPRKKPFVVAEHMTGDTTHAQIIEAYREGTKEALKSRGGTFDPAATDLSRAFYGIAQRSSRKPLPKPVYVQGQASDFDPFFAAALKQVKAKQTTKSRARGSSQKTGQSSSSARVECDGRDVVAWYVRHKDFDFETLFADKGLVKSDRTSGGVHVECFHDCHSETDSETFLVNGDGDKGLTLHCSGASGGCPEITDRLLRLTKYIEAGKLTIEDLENPAYGGGPVPLAKATKKPIREAIGKLGTDSTSDDWDPVVEMIARFGDESFDAEALELICNKTGKKLKTKLDAKIKSLRKEFKQQRREEARTSAGSDEDVRRFHDWENNTPFRDTTDAVVEHLERRNARNPTLYKRGKGYARVIANHTTGLLEAEQTGVVDELRDYWVGGKMEQTEPPRWSVIRDVLRWVD